MEIYIYIYKVSNLNIFDKLCFVCEINAREDSNFLKVSRKDAPMTFSKNFTFVALLAHSEKGTVTKRIKNRK